MKIAHAQWTATDPATPHRYDGTCEKCHEVRPAISLALRSLGFGRGDQWACKGGCLADLIMPDPPTGGGAKAAWATRRAYLAGLKALAAQAR